MRRLLLGCLAIALLGVSAAAQDDPAARARRGKAALAAGDFNEAARIYSKLVEEIPDNPGLRLNLGMAYHMGGRDGEAVGEFEKVVAEEPDMAPALLFLGAAYVRLGRPGKAVEPLQRLVKLRPDDAQARGMLGDALQADGRFEAAAAQFKRLTALRAEDPGAWSALGQAYEGLARDSFDRLHDADPESAYVLALIAEARVVTRQYRAAFFLYRQALERLPDLRGAHAAVAEIYRLTDREEWAEKEERLERAAPPLDCAREILPCRFASGEFTGVLEAARGKDGLDALYWKSRAANELARHAFERLAALPDSVESLRLRARIEREQRRYVEAVELWRAALKLAPSDGDLAIELAIDLFLSRDFEGALKIVSELQKQGRPDPRLAYIRGGALLSLQNAEEAVPWLKKAVEADPDLLDARLALGRALMQTGQAEAAIPNLEAALSIDLDGDVRYQLARAYQRTGRRELARKTLAEYQRMRKAAEAQQREVEEDIEITAP